MPSLRRLSLGIILLAVWMAFFAESGIGEAFFPLSPNPPGPPAVGAVLNVAVPVLLAAIGVACLALLGLGLMALRASVPAVRERLTWRWGTVRLSPGHIIGGLGLLSVVLFPIGIGLAVMATIGGGRWPLAFLFFEAFYVSLFIAIGWCLMVFPARALGPWTTRTEGRVVTAATVVISAAALFDVTVQFIIAGVGVSTLIANPTASIPTAPSWAQGFSALAALLGLLVVAWVARRIVHRMKRPGVQATATPL